MTIDAIRRMDIGQIVDYIIEWNEIHAAELEPADGKTGKKGAERREATQADWDAFFGA